MGQGHGEERAVLAGNVVDGGAYGGATTERGYTRVCYTNSKGMTTRDTRCVSTLEDDFSTLDDYDYDLT